MVTAVNTEEALALLGLSGNASHDQIRAKVQEHYRLWSNRVATAPTVAGRQEAERQVELLDKARQVLDSPDRGRAHTPLPEPRTRHSTPEPRSEAIPTSAPSPRHDNPSRGGKNRLNRALVIGLVGIAMFVVGQRISVSAHRSDAALTNGEGDPPTTTTLAQQVPVQAGAVAYPNAYEASLLSHIPSGLQAGGHCHHLDVGRSSDSAIECDIGRGSVAYFHNKAGADLYNGYRRWLDSAREENHSVLGDECSPDQPSGEAVYNDESGNPIGRVLCYIRVIPNENSELGQHINWTNDRLQIYASSSNFGSDTAGAFAAWRMAGPT